MSTSEAARIDAMQAMVTKYTTNFPRHHTILLRAAQPPVDTVLLVGTTRALGSQLLMRLAENTRVRRVYALDRPLGGQTARDRLAKVLQERGADTGVLGTDKVVLVEGDPTQSKLGLPDDTYKQIHRTTTLIIHTAWEDDPIADLPLFEPQIQGVRNLVDFALTSKYPTPPRVLFLSSHAVLQNAPPEALCPESPIDPSWAAGTGSAEAKWVCEQILYAAASAPEARTRLDPLIVRASTICGAPNGAWAPDSDGWFPSLAQSAAALGCFPDDPKAVNWLPLDRAADAIVEFRKASPAAHTVHLAHPRPAPWHALAAAASVALAVPLVPYHAWLEKLEAASTDGKLRALEWLPSLRKLEQKEGQERGRIAFGFADMDTTLARESSPTLADPNMPQLSGEDVVRWLDYWRDIGLL